MNLNGGATRRPRSRRATTVTGLVSVVALAVGGCGTAGTGGSVAGGFPSTVASCGRDVPIERVPQRVVALGPSEVTTIVAAGGASTLVGRDDAGKKSDAYPADLRAAVAAVPQLASGGEVTRENVIALQPDLVVGSVSETVTPDSLDAVGIPLLSLRGNCGSNHAPGQGDGTADFDDVYSDVGVLGRLFGTSAQADATIASLRGRVAAARPSPAMRNRSAAAAIVFENGLKVYGRRSMAHTQFQALGLRDVFADADDRVFDASVEELISRNPDVVVLLSYGETDQEAGEKFLRIPGASSLNAVRNGAVFVQPYEFSSQGVLSVDGLENMVRTLAAAPQR